MNSHSNEGPLSKEKLYEIFSENLKMVKNQLRSQKKYIRQKKAEYYYFIEYNKQEKATKILNEEIIPNCRLYIFLIGNFLELNLYKTIYSNSSVAFTDTEIDSIISKRQILEQWKECIGIAMTRISDDSYWKGISKREITDSFSNKFYKDLEDLITSRNKLAHGGWKVQLSGSRKKIQPSKIVHEYQNIQHLYLYMKRIDLITSLINTLVVYKEKESINFSEIISKILEEIRSIDGRLKSKKTEEDCLKTEIKSFSKLEKMKREYFSNLKNTSTKPK